MRFMPRSPEAIVPMAPLVNDPVNDIQLEAIDAELAFFLVEPIQVKKRVALVVEKRIDSRAPGMRPASSSDM